MYMYWIKFIFISAEPEGKRRCTDITCSSRNGRITTCRVPRGRIITKLSLKKQISQTSCKRPKIRFGIRRNRIWVVKGCKGTFSYCYTSATRVPPLKVPGVRRCADISCSSRNGSYTTCRVPRYRVATKVLLKRQVSRINCKRPKLKFGIRRNRIWVNNGCNGIFTYCYKERKKIVAPKIKADKCARISCSSRNSKHTICRVASNRVIANLTLDKQTSRKSCQLPKKRFGVENNKVWVDKGCSGRFTYCYATGEAERFADIACSSFQNRYKACAVPQGRIITELALKRQISKNNCEHPERVFGIRHDNKIWVNKGCRGVFRYGYATGNVMISYKQLILHTYQPQTNWFPSFESQTNWFPSFDSLSWQLLFSANFYK